MQNTGFSKAIINFFKTRKPYAYTARPGTVRKALASKTQIRLLSENEGFPYHEIGEVQIHAEGEGEVINWELKNKQVLKLAENIARKKGGNVLIAANKRGVTETCLRKYSKGVSTRSRFSYSFIIAFA